jgi:hypothetical protein
MQRTNRPRRPVVVFLVLLGLATLSSSAEADRSCFNVEGEIDYLNNSPLCGSGTVSGDLGGTVIGCVLQIIPGGNGALHVIAENTFFPAGGGSFSTMDRATLAPTTAPNVYLVNGRFEIVSGTGIYAGATGRLQSQAVVDFNVGSYIGGYHGPVCLP